jgi:KUP system potassium uptake protein
MFDNDILYQDNAFITIKRSGEAFGVSASFKEEMAPGLRVFEIRSGYMEIVAVESLLRKFKINEKSIFYGIEDIVTRNPAWKIYSLIKRLTPSFVQFHKLPPHKLHGVVFRVEI